jgi:bifunctional DNA-binding transcriptional regulator/antitoxin component of YhaV-PrlF toxin-antitoxin module
MSNDEKVYILPVKMNKEGRIQIPAIVRNMMGWKHTDMYSLSMGEDTVIINRITVTDAKEEQTATLES